MGLASESIVLDDTQQRPPCRAASSAPHSTPASAGSCTSGLPAWLWSCCSPESACCAGGLPRLIPVQREVVANASEIRTKVLLDKTLRKWDVVVVNEDGQEDRLTGAFEITP